MDKSRHFSFFWVRMNFNPNIQDLNFPPVRKILASERKLGFVQIYYLYLSKFKITEVSFWLFRGIIWVKKFFKKFFKMRNLFMKHWVLIHIYLRGGLRESVKRFIEFFCLSFSILKTILSKLSKCDDQLSKIYNF